MMLTNTIYNTDSKEEKQEKEALDSISKKKEQFFLEKRVIFLTQEIDDKKSKEIIEKLLLLEYDQPKTTIHLHINSPGGTVSEGMAIYDTMQLISSPVSTICMGLAASMASVLLSGGAKGKRFIFPHGEVMIHQPLLSGHMRAVSKDLEIEAEQMEKIKYIVASLTAKNTRQTLAKVMKDMDRNFWMNAEESIKYGIVDATTKLL